MLWAETWRAVLGAWTVRIIVPLIIIGIVLWVHLYEFSAILQWDSYVYLIIGKYVARGLLPYRDLWELKPPGVFWYLGAVFSVLPVKVWSVRVTDFLLYTVAAAAFYRLCRLEASRPLAIVGTGLWVYFAHHPDFNLGGVYTEEYAAICDVMALAAVITYCKSGRMAAVWLAGLLTAGAILCKHPGGAVVLPILVVMTERPSPRAFAAFIFATALPLALTVAYFWYRGALHDFLDCVVWVPLSYGRLGQTGGGALWSRVEQLATAGDVYVRQHLVFGGALAVGVPVCALRPTRLRLAALAWLGLDMAGIVAQGHYYAHHFIQMFPSLFFVGTLGAAWWVQPRGGEKWPVCALRAAAAGVAVWCAWPLVSAAIAARQPAVHREWTRLLSGPTSWQQDPGGPVEEALGTYIRDRTRPNDRVHMFAWGSTILGTYWVADRVPACRHFHPIMLYGTMLGEEVSELERTRPVYIVVLGSPFDQLMRYVVAHYSLETVPSRTTAQVWVRNHAESFSSGATVGLAQDSAHDGLGLASADMPSASRAPAVRPVAGRHVDVTGGAGAQRRWEALR